MLVIPIIVILIVLAVSYGASGSMVRPLIIAITTAKMARETITERERFSPSRSACSLCTLHLPAAVGTWVSAPYTSTLDE